MAYTFDDPEAAERHTTQYFEMFGNRGIYHNGWTAVTKHRTPWLMGAIELPAFDDDNWELYNTNEDWTQAHDLSAEYPEKLHELQRLWLIEAVKYNVLPIDDRTAERFNSELAGRPDLMAGRSSMRLDGYSQRISENAAPNTKNKSFSVTAELVVPEGGAEGVIATQGGAFGGWGLYAKEGKLKYCYNFIGLDHAYVEAEQPLEPGEHQVRIEFRYDGGGIGKGADLVLFVEGEEVGQGRTERSIPYLISLDETLDVGMDAGTPVTDDYPARGNEFNGKIKWVQIDLEPDDHSHMIDIEHMAHVRLSQAVGLQVRTAGPQRTAGTSIEKEMALQTENVPTGLTKYVPIAGWLSRYQPAWLRFDLVAGLTAAAVVIPQAMAYAAIAGLPVQVGLYTALVPMLIYVLLGTSRPLSVSSTSTISMLTATELARVAQSGDPADYLVAASTLALLVGVFLLLAGLLRLGFLANFVSRRCRPASRPA